jgi:hypothetical protein
MSDFELIQQGRHRATCFEFEFPEPKPGRAQAIALGFRMSDGDVDQGRVITAWKYFADGALAYTLEALRACGWRGDNPADITIADLANEVELVVQHEEYEGKWRAKVSFINPLGGGMVKAEKRLEGNNLKSFGAAMRAKIRALDGGQRPAPKPAQTGQPATSPQHTTRQAAPHPNAPSGGDWDAPPQADPDIPF